MLPNHFASLHEAVFFSHFGSRFSRSISPISPVSKPASILRESILLYPKTPALFHWNWHEDCYFLRNRGKRYVEISGEQLILFRVLIFGLFGGNATGNLRTSSSSGFASNPARRYFSRSPELRTNLWFRPDECARGPCFRGAGWNLLSSR